MADEDLGYLLGDHPTTEAQITALVVNLSKLVKDFREFKTDVNNGIQKNTESIDALRLLQKEQNGNVATIKDRQNEIKKWVEGHTDWHGEEDKKIAERIHQEEIVDARHQSVVDLLKFQWKLGGGLIGTGLIIGKLVNFLGWW